MKPYARGLVWIVVGLAVYLGGLVVGLPLVVRGTRVPWGLLVAGAGVLILAWDSWRASRGR
jgi:hypothetical protein